MDIIGPKKNDRPDLEADRGRNAATGIQSRTATRFTIPGAISLSVRATFATKESSDGGAFARRAMLDVRSTIDVEPAEAAMI